MRPSGDLERQIMQIIWQDPTPLTGHDIRARLDGTRNAYTTVVTVLERLRSKGMLTRFRDGRSYRYRACVDADQHVAMLMSRVLDSSSDRTAALLRFADALSPEEVAELRAALQPGAAAGGGPPPDDRA